MLKIVSNKIRCKFCGDILESFSVHDFKRCRCGKCSTDGGLEYIRRSFVTENPKDTFEDLSTYVDENGKLINASDVNKKDIPIDPIRVESDESDEVEKPEVVAELDDSLTKTTYSPDIPEVTEERRDEPLKEEKIVKCDKNGKPNADRYPYDKE